MDGGGGHETPVHTEIRTWDFPNTYRTTAKFCTANMSANTSPSFRTPRPVIKLLSRSLSQFICNDTALPNEEYEQWMDLSSGYQSKEFSDNWTEAVPPTIMQTYIHEEVGRIWGGPHCIPPHEPAFPINHSPFPPLHHFQTGIIFPSTLPDECDPSPWSVHSLNNTRPFVLCTERFSTFITSTKSTERILSD